MRNGRQRVTGRLTGDSSKEDAHVDALLFCTARKVLKWMRSCCGGRMLFHNLLVVAAVFAVVTAQSLVASPAFAQTCIVDPMANIDQSQPAGTCVIRNLSASQCGNIPGKRHFKPDSGSGFTECFFTPPAGGTGSANGGGGGSGGGDSAALRRLNQRLCAEEKQRFDKLVSDIQKKPWGNMQDAAEFLGQQVNNHLREWCPPAGMNNVVDEARVEIANLISQVAKDRQFLTDSCNKAKAGFVTALNSYKAGSFANAVLETSLQFLQGRCSAADMDDVVRWAEGETAKAERESRLAVCQRELDLMEQDRRKYGSPNSEPKQKLVVSMQILAKTCAEFRDKSCPNCLPVKIDEALARLTAEVKNDREIEEARKKAAPFAANDPIRNPANPFPAQDTQTPDDIKVKGAKEAFAANDPLKRAANPFNGSGSSSPGPGAKLLWQGTSDPADCAHANAVQRSSALFGVMCLSPVNATQRVPQTRDQQQSRHVLTFIQLFEADILNAFDTGTSLTQALIDYLANISDSPLKDDYRKYLGCDAAESDATCFGNRFKQIIDQQNDLRAKGLLPPRPAAPGGPVADDDAPPPDPGFRAAGKSCDFDPADKRIYICLQAASTGYCKKWRETVAGRHVLPWDWDPLDTQSFSDNVINAGIYTQPCTADALDKFAKAIKSP
jgi:hypothetical protein